MDDFEETDMGPIPREPEQLETSDAYETIDRNMTQYYKVFESIAELSELPTNAHGVREACCLSQIKNLSKKFRQRVGQMERSHNSLQLGDTRNYASDRKSASRIRNHTKAHFNGTKILSQISLIAQTAGEGNIGGLNPAARRRIEKKINQYSRTLFYLWNSVSASNLERDTTVADGKFTRGNNNEILRDANQNDIDHVHKSITGCLTDALDMALSPVLNDNRIARSIRDRLSRKMAIVKRNAANISLQDLVGERKDFRKIVKLTSTLLEISSDLRRFNEPLRSGAMLPVIQTRANRENGARIIETVHDLYQRNIRRLLHQAILVKGASSERIGSTDLHGATMEFEGNWLETNIADGTTGKVVLKGELMETSIPGFYTLNAIDKIGEVGLWGEWTGAAFPNPIRLTDNAISSVEFVTAGSISTLTIAFAPPSDNNPPVINGVIDDPLSVSPSFSIPPIVYTFDTSQRNAEMIFVGATTASSAVNFGGVQLLLNGKGFLKINKA